MKPRDQPDHPSRVSAADRAVRLPGDELVERPVIVMDRAAELPAPPADVWPWLVQLGKGRGWWYLPRWAERFVRDRAKRGARRIIPELQVLAVGDTVPDWGPGDPVFRVAAIEPPSALVYHSLRQRSRDWRWPEPGTPRPPDCLELSWALTLAPLPGDRARLHIRLRVAGVRRLTKPLFALGGGLLDRVTIRLLVSGLRERLTDS